jgi:hypothetical protein
MDYMDYGHENYEVLSKSLKFLMSTKRILKNLDSQGIPLRGLL